MSWPRWREWRQDAAYVGGLFLVAVSFMWPVWQRPDDLWYLPKAAFSDLTVTHWPNMWFVAQTWRDSGFEVTTNVGGHGVVGMLRNGPGPTLMLRCDLDALPVTEQTQLPYASTRKIECTSIVYV